MNEIEAELKLPPTNQDQDQDQDQVSLRPHMVIMTAKNVTYYRWYKQNICQSERSSWRYALPNISYMSLIFQTAS